MNGLLTITAEPLSDRMAGPAIRALELSRAVSRSGVPGTLLSLASSAGTDPEVELVGPETEQRIRDRVAGADVVLIQGDVLNLQPWLASAQVPIVVDAYDPFHFEQLEQARIFGEARRRTIVRECVAALNAQLARADLVLAASSRQRDLWLGHLAAIGRINPVTYDDDHHLRNLIRIVPFGLPNDQPRRPSVPVMRGVLPGIKRESVIALWAGGIYDWFDPSLVLEAFTEALERTPQLSLVFFGGSHPVLGPVPPTQLETRARCEELARLGVPVHFVSRWVPYAERGNWLAEADLAVVANRAGIEAEFAFRTRVLDHLWAGLPTVGTLGDPLVNRISAAGGGIGVEPGDRAGFAAALTTLADPVERSAAAAITRSLADDYRWDRVAEGLVQFCHSPARAPDLALPAAEQLVLGMATQPFRPGPVRRLRRVLTEGGPSLLVRRALARLPLGRSG